MKDFSGLSPDNFTPQPPAIAEDPLMNAFRAYAQARDEFHQACHGLAQAQERRARADKQLQQISEQLTEAVRVNLIDPTAPQTTQGPPNGGWGMGAQNQQYAPGGLR